MRIVGLVVSGLLLASSFGCLSLAFSAQTAAKSDAGILSVSEATRAMDRKSATPGPIRYGVMTERLRTGVMTERLRNDRFALAAASR